MSRTWRTRAAPLAMLVVAACADAPVTGPVLEEGDPPTGLAIVVPEVTEAIFLQESTDAGGALTGRPAVGAGATEDAAGVAASWSTSVANIYDARTTAGFAPGSAWAVGEHRYQGNKGRIETTVSAAFGGTQIGSQTAYRQDDLTFWLDFGAVKYISAIARLYTDRGCGLTAWGSSRHQAWWEAVPGANIATFGKVERSTTSDAARQEDCAPAASGGGGGGGGGDTDGAYCFLSVWFDLDTREVLDVDVLYCEMGG